MIRLKPWLLAFASYLVLSILASWFLIFSPGIVGHNWDWPFDWRPQGLHAVAANAFSAWGSYSLGQNNPIISNALYFLFEGLIANGKTLGTLTLISVPSLGAMAGMLLTRQVALQCRIDSILGAWLGGLCFGFSPFFFNELQAGSTNQLTAHIAAALTVSFIALYIRTGSLRWVCCACLSSVALASSVTDFTLCLLVSVLLLFGYFGLRAWKPSVLFLVGAAFVNAYWLFHFIPTSLQLAHQSFYVTNALALTGRVGLASESFLNSGYPYSFFDNGQPIVAVSAGLFLIATFTMGLLLLQRHRLLYELRVWVVLFFAGAAASEVGRGPIGPLMLWLYNHISVMGLFRSPQHLIIVPALSKAVLVGIGWSTVMPRLGRVRAFMVIVIFLLGCAPFFTGDLSSANLASRNIGNSGTALSLFEPSPGYARLAKAIDSSPKWSRALFVPFSASPLYLSTPFQQFGNGGDTLLNPTFEHGTMSDAFNPITEAFVNELPASLASGLPRVWDASTLTIRYDVLDNPGGPWRFDKLLSYRTRQFLHENRTFWKPSMSADYVDFYQTAAPGRIYMLNGFFSGFGDASDVLDFEFATPALGLAWSGTAPQTRVESAPKVAFENRWDGAVDSLLRNGASTINRKASFDVPHAGVYTILVKRKFGKAFGAFGISIDGFSVVSRTLGTRVATDYNVRGARWAKVGTVQLNRGVHALSIDSDVVDYGSSVGGYSQVDASNVDQFAVLPVNEVPTQPDFVYGPALVIGIEHPLVSEMHSRQIRVARDAHFKLLALLHAASPTQEFSALSYVPRQAVVTIDPPFIHSEDPAPLLEQDMPLAWYVSRPLPRLGPDIAIRPISGSVGYLVSSGTPMSGHLSLMLSALDANRTAVLALGGARSQIQLTGAGGPFGSYGASVFFSGLPHQIKVPTDLSGEATAQLDITPPITVRGIVGGLPVALQVGSSLSLASPKAFPLQLSSQILISQRGRKFLGHQTAPLPIQQLKRIELRIRPAETSQALQALGNAYVRCPGRLSSYEVPVSEIPVTNEAAPAVLVMDLSALRQMVGDDRCTMYGFAFKLQQRLGFPSANLHVIQADLFTNSTWLRETTPLKIERYEQANVSNISTRLAADQRILSFSFPGRLQLPNLIIDSEGIPVGEKFDLTGWRPSPAQFPLHTVADADLLDPSGSLLLAANQGRAVLSINDRIIPVDRYADPTGPYWSFQGPNTIRLTWPFGKPLPDRGTITIIPSEWFSTEGDSVRLEIDMQRPGFQLHRALIRLRIFDPVYTAAAVDATAYELSQTPPSILPVDVDGRTIVLRAANPQAGISPYTTKPFDIFLRRGIHNITFTGGGTQDRLFLIQRTARLDRDVEKVQNLESSLASTWQFDVPRHKTIKTLVFADAYDDSWELHGLSGAQHVMVDGLLNAWVLPPGPKAHVILYYGKQRLVTYGSFASASAIIILVLGALLWRKSGHSNNSHHETVR